MLNNESVGKKIVEALKKQAESIDVPEETETLSFGEETVSEPQDFNVKNDIFSEPAQETAASSFFDDVEEEKEPLFSEPVVQNPISDNSSDGFEMPANMMPVAQLEAIVGTLLAQEKLNGNTKEIFEFRGLSVLNI